MLGSNKSNVTIVGIYKQSFKDGGSLYSVAFYGSFVPRFGDLTGSVAGVTECSEELYKKLLDKKFPFACSGAVIQDSKKRTYELADITL